uniref:Uncharacterized protein n=1 Tax=Anguilla anguilla TaxID=7936 RepID=A0A0E9WXI5_ANGAN
MVQCLISFNKNNSISIVTKVQQYPDFYLYVLSLKNIWVHRIPFSKYQLIN